MIEVKGLGKSFGKQEVLKNLSLTLEDEKIYGLLGRNGVGKTTLLRLIAGHLLVKKGEILLDGEKILENPKCTRQIAYISEQGFGVDLKVKELFSYGRKLYSNWNENLLREVLSIFPIQEKKKIVKLSRGQRTAVSLAMGLASGARYTFFDEPSLGLDAANRYHFYQKILEEFDRGGRTFIISTHIIDEAANLFEEAIILRDQEVYLKEEVASLLSRGFSLRGRSELLDGLKLKQTLLDTQSFGASQIRSYYGVLSQEERQRIDELGLDLERLSLQNLFVHLTEGVKHV